MSTLEYTTVKIEKEIFIRNIYGFVHKCKKCSYFTKSLFFMRNHIKRHRSASKVLFDCWRSTLEIYLCKECNFETYETTTFKQHIKNHLLKKTAIFPQNVTNQACDEDEFKRHRSESKLLFDCSRSTPENFSCKKCNFETFLTTTFIQHIKNHTLQLLALSPQNATSTAFDVHEAADNSDINGRKSMKVSVKREKRFQCDKCQFKGAGINYLKNHIISKHTPLENIEWFHCNKCSYKAKLKINLKKHIYYKHTASSDIKWFHCEKCPFKTKRKTDVESHVTAKHMPASKRKRNECDQCSFRAATKEDLRRHRIRKHTEVEEFQASFKIKLKNNWKELMSNKCANSEMSG